MLGPPKCYCMLLLFAEGRADAGPIIKIPWDCPDGFPENTPNHSDTHPFGMQRGCLGTDVTRCPWLKLRAVPHAQTNLTLLMQFNKESLCYQKQGHGESGKVQREMWPQVTQDLII